MIEAIVITSSEDRDGSIVDLFDDLAGTLSTASKRNKSSLSEDLLNFHPDGCEALVAGVGFEPTTFRL